MIIHLVAFQPRRDLTRADRRALADAFARAVREIPSVRRATVGRRVRHGAAYEPHVPDADYVALIEFDDLAGLEAYLQHPAHADLGARFNASLSSALIYDVDAGGIERLEDLVSG